MGLSICHGIVTALGGEISVTSRLGTGSTFSVSLPAANGAPASKAPESAPAASARHGRVLVVDDEPAVCRIVERALHADHEVVIETDARPALSRLIRGERYDVILCDLMMPMMSGADFYHAVQSAQPELAKRIVFLTGGAFSARAEQFLKEVERPVVAKPFTPSGLRAVVSEYIA